MAASYPGAVKSFATRSNGQAMDASHVNDLQDEVTAIEDGIVNGTAPINSSRITATSLSLTGNSTVGGNLTVTGTLTATLTAPAVRVSHSALQQVAAATWTGLNWDTEAYDSTGMHSTSANSSRLTFAGSTGIYHVGATVQWSSLASGPERRLRIMFNDSSVVTRTDIGSPGGGLATAMQLSAAVRVGATTDYVTLQVFQDTSTGSIQAESTGVALGFWAHRVSA